MKVITNASQKARDLALAEMVASNVATLANDPEWQATLAGIREQFPNGVMHK